jgi:hypothetical protein
MSSILDSLKKSQQQRGNSATGPATGLSFGRDPAASPATGRWRTPALIVFLLALLGWGFQEEIQAWWSSGQTTGPQLSQSKPSGAKVPPVQEKQTKPINKTTGQSRQIAHPDPQQIREKLRALAQQPDAARQKNLPPGVLEQEQAKLASNLHPSAGSVQNKFDSKAARSADRLENRTAPGKQPVHKTLRQPLAQGRDQAQAQIRPGTEPQKRPMSPTGPSDQPTAAPVPVTQQEHSPAQTGSQPYRFLYQLPYAVRKNLPALTLNIHVYDQDPKHRLVVINGLDLAIGDTLEGTEVTVKDIIPEGALLSAGGEVFLLPNQR